MARAPFTIPDGLVVTPQGDRLLFSYPGAVHVDAALAAPIDIDAKGDVEISRSVKLGTVHAEGTIYLRADVEAVRLHGRHVVLGSGEVKARSISADQSIQVGAAKVAVDALVAPHVQIEPNASGRVTIIEARNERTTSRIKGGFSLAEYTELFGDAVAYLAERGLKPLPDGASATEMAPADAPEDEPPAPPPADDEDVSDPLSLSVEDLEPLSEVDDELHKKLKDAVNKIAGCYDGVDLPPPLVDLKALVDGKDLATLKGTMNNVWNSLLAYHQKRGMRPHHQVTHSFNIIHGLVNQGT